MQDEHVTLLRTIVKELENRADSCKLDSELWTDFLLIEHAKSQEVAFRVAASIVRREVAMAGIVMSGQEGDSQ